jgi:hypothetical protein
MNKRLLNACEGKVFPEPNFTLPTMMLDEVRNGYLFLPESYGL